MSPGMVPMPPFVKERIILSPPAPTLPTARGPWEQLEDQTLLTEKAAKVWRKVAFTP